MGKVVRDSILRMLTKCLIETHIVEYAATGMRLGMRAELRPRPSVGSWTLDSTVLTFSD